MQIVSFIHNGSAAYGLLESGGIRPASAALRQRWRSLKALMTAGELARLASGVDPDTVIEPHEVEFLPPVPVPGRILCVGMNYLAHIHEMGREPPEHPAFFVRFPDSLVGAGQPLVRPKVSEKYDFEGELAVVIGRTARYVSRDDALDCVAGYSCFMDGSVRDYQRHTSQFTAGKNFPRSGAMGPCMVTADEIPDPSVLTLQTRVSGERMQYGELSDLCIDVPSIIEYASTICELHAGDVIATGTPSGVGFARKPPRWLVPGDTVEVEINSIGVLSNPVQAE